MRSSQFHRIAVFALFPPVVVLALPVSANSTLRGDVDGSGSIDALDVQLVVNAALGRPVHCSCDLDLSGCVDAADLQICINAALGMSVGARVPDLFGLPRTDALGAIRAARLVPGTVAYRYDESVPDGHVAAQRPAPRLLVDWGAVVDLEVSLGTEDTLVDAPVGPLETGTHVTPTTQIVKPAGQSIEFLGRAIDIALSPDETTLAVKNWRGLEFIDLTKKALVQTLKFYSQEAQGTFAGLAWSQDGSRVWTTDTTQYLRAAVRGTTRRFAWANAIYLPAPNDRVNSGLSGVAVDEENNRAYVCMSGLDSLGVVDLAASKLVGQIPVGIAPYTLLKQGSRVYVSNWGGRIPGSSDTVGSTYLSYAVVDPETGIASTGSVSVVDLQHLEVIGEMAVGLHPSDLALSPDGTTLYVANANSDTVSVIDTSTHAVVDTLDIRPLSGLPFGSGPDALALSREGSFLYVALSTNNCVAEVDTRTRCIRGLIPTGWYPSGIEVASGGTLLVANLKGSGGRYGGSAQGVATAPVCGPAAPPTGWWALATVGSVSVVARPDTAELAEFTRQAAEGMRLPLMASILNLDEAPLRALPAPRTPAARLPIKHVVYIIKENRTYDQVFGDLAQGNGEPSLCLFPRDVTPNHHALAEEFVLFDSFYCNGVSSAEGHQWTDEGYAGDYVEKNYRNAMRSYPYNGGDCLAYASSGFIWDHVLRKGLTFRGYGEFTKAGISPTNATWTQLYRDYLSGTASVSVWATPQLHTLAPHVCPRYPGFSCVVPDVRRAREFLDEFRAMESSGCLPNLTLLLLPNDHTSGTVPGRPTPRAALADNDLALGQIVDAITHSRFWAQTVVFVVEDDPSGGLDHVDGHRTVALCISPYTKRGYVDSHHYNQTSLLRTIELFFGMEPMNQLTLASNPLTDCFQDTPTFTPYTVRPNRVALDDLNPPLAALNGKQRLFALKSLEQPLDELDQADEETMNRILWHSVKGYDTPYPALSTEDFEEEGIGGR